MMVRVWSATLVLEDVVELADDDEPHAVRIDPVTRRRTAIEPLRLMSTRTDLASLDWADLQQCLHI
jgi:hypothetical protein